MAYRDQSISCHDLVGLSVGGAAGFVQSCTAGRIQYEDARMPESDSSLIIPSRIDNAVNALGMITIPCAMCNLPFSCPPLPTSGKLEQINSDVKEKVV